MSIIRAVLLVVAFIAVPFGVSQNPSTEQVGTMSVIDARKFLSTTTTGKQAKRFVDAAIESGRPEIIELGWESSSTSDFLRDAVFKMPDSRLKDELASRYLRRPQDAWPTEQMRFFNGQGMTMGVSEFIIPLVRRHLPDTPLDFSVISTSEKRTKLADAFDAAAGIPIVKEPEAKRVWPPHVGGKQDGKPTPPNGGGPAPSANGSAPIVAMSNARQPSYFLGSRPLWAGIAAVVAAAAGWLFLRSKGKKG